METFFFLGEKVFQEINLTAGYQMGCRDGEI